MSRLTSSTILFWSLPVSSGSTNRSATNSFTSPLIALLSTSHSAPRPLSPPLHSPSIWQSEAPMLLLIPSPVHKQQLTSSPMPLSSQPPPSHYQLPTSKRPTPTSRSTQTSLGSSFINWNWLPFRFCQSIQLNHWSSPTRPPSNPTKISWPPGSTRKTGMKE